MPPMPGGGPPPGGPPPPGPPPGGGPPPPGPPGRPPPRAPPIPGGGASLSASPDSPRLPKPHVRESRRLRLTAAGPRPEFRWMIDVPGAGLRLKHPKPATYFSEFPLQDDDATFTSAGRWNAPPSPSGSDRPVVMLYGVPLLTLKKGVAWNLNGKGMPVPITARWRTSPKEDGPHSALRL